MRHTGAHQYREDYTYERNEIVLHFGGFDAKLFANDLVRIRTMKGSIQEGCE
jgi:hypothetical protein